MTWTVHKFGGTSVADASCIRRVAGMIGGQSRDNNLAVVVSAMKGVTDDLLGLVDKAAKRLRSASEQLATLTEKLYQAEEAEGSYLAHPVLDHLVKVGINHLGGAVPEEGPGERDPGFDARPRPGDPLVRRLGKHVVPQRFRLTARLIATRALAGRARRRAG